MNANVCIVTGAHLCRNPRVVKEATALGKAGHNVTVLAPLLRDELVDDDEAILSSASFRRVVSIDARPSRGHRSFLSRGVRRLALEANRRWKTERPEALGYGLWTTLTKARTSGADYYVGHQETGAWVVWKLMQEGYSVGADLEDWYSRDLLPDAQVVRPITLLDRVEGDLVRSALHCTTTSEAMADAMEREYGNRPDILYNAFPWAERDHLDGQTKDRICDGRPSLFWFSQTIGPGRGLEHLIDALSHVGRPVQLHLRGSVAEDYRRVLEQAFPTDRGHSLSFHSLVSPQELLSRIAEHDIGMALEDVVPPSRNLTITNKILQYLQGGLAVVATPTAGQREVSQRTNGAVILSEADVLSLGEAIQSLVSGTEKLQEMKARALFAARHVFSWEAQERRLESLVSRAFVSSGS